MAESQNQGDKGRKPRPFGSFLLFLTVIVVVLVAFSGSALRNTQQFSQDEFLYHLVTGRVEQLKFKGQNVAHGCSKRRLHFNHCPIARSLKGRPSVQGACKSAWKPAPVTFF